MVVGTLQVLLLLLLLLLVGLDMLLEVVLAPEALVTGGQRTAEGPQAGVDAAVAGQLLVARETLLAVGKFAAKVPLT